MFLHFLLGKHTCFYQVDHKSKADLQSADWVAGSAEPSWTKARMKQLVTWARWVDGQAKRQA